jgi:hypothetical protein
MIAAMRTREVGLIVLAAFAGGAIAFLDSRPGWDDTGITVGLLLLAAGAAAFASGRRPWLWAVLVGAWTPGVEMATGGSVASLAALAFASLGAFGGWAIRRSLQAAERPGAPPRESPR